MFTNASSNGKPATQFDSMTQVVAISALMSGMTLDQNNNPPTSSSDLPPSVPSVPKAAIAGSVVGGIMGIAVIIILTWLYKHRKHGINWPWEPSHPELIVSPFQLQASAVDRKSRGPSDLKQTRSGASSMTSAHSEVVTGPVLPAEMIPDPVLPTSQFVDITLDDLVLELNQRLQSEQMQIGRGWDPDEAPPRYPESQQG
ncbi:hypothetical protein V5O48_003729 [Marasmius crinis-equi]|uniref:Uncharacterized protein n=1 Tax=Marasmius crinis-equi TaxID=585013 RepID=A0ABR3FS20_9AGAR